MFQKGKLMTMNKIINRQKKLTHEEYLSLVTDYLAMEQNGKGRKYTGQQLAEKYQIDRTSVYRYLRKAETENINI